LPIKIKFSECVGVCGGDWVTEGVRNDSLMGTGKQIPGARSPGYLNYVRWCVIFVGLQYETYINFPFRCVIFWGGSYISEKRVDPCSSKHSAPCLLNLQPAWLEGLQHFRCYPLGYRI